VTQLPIDDDTAAAKGVRLSTAGASNETLAEEGMINRMIFTPAYWL